MKPYTTDNNMTTDRTLTPCTNRTQHLSAQKSHKENLKIQKIIRILERKYLFYYQI